MEKFFDKYGLIVQILAFAPTALATDILCAEIILFSIQLVAFILFVIGRIKYPWQM